VHWCNHCLTSMSVGAQVQSLFDIYVCRCTGAIIVWHLCLSVHWCNHCLTSMSVGALVQSLFDIYVCRCTGASIVWHLCLSVHWCKHCLTSMSVGALVQALFDIACCTFQVPCLPTARRVLGRRTLWEAPTMGQELASYRCASNKFIKKLKRSVILIYYLIKSNAAGRVTTCSLIASVTRMIRAALF